jgi:caffeoyl-CoA O-methyltransferase
VGPVTRRPLPLTDDLHDYMLAHSSPEDPVLARLAAETAGQYAAAAVMQIGADQGTLLTLLAATAAPRLAVEVGTFTGYSAICLARGLAPGGRLICCDISEEWTSVARRYWQDAGLADRIELRLAPALDTLRALPPGPDIDLAFIDAHKPEYVGYWEEIVPRTRPGGLILADNTLWDGEVVRPENETARLVAAFNDHVAADNRVEQVMLPVGDGLTLARRK